ncbi:hypothetical protein CTA2_12296, partial [Colletotrichum tanaceti]
DPSREPLRAYLPAAAVVLSPPRAPTPGRFRDAVRRTSHHSVATAPCTDLLQRGSVEELGFVHYAELTRGRRGVGELEQDAQARGLRVGRTSEAHAAAEVTEAADDGGLSNGEN